MEAFELLKNQNQYLVYQVHVETVVEPTPVPGTQRVEGVITKSGFQYGKFANNLFSILKQLVTVPHEPILLQLVPCFALNNPC